MVKNTQLRIATWNLWGHSAPGPYWRDRGEFRGAAPDSKATQAFDGRGVWKRRRLLLVKALQSTEPYLICLQEAVGSGTSLAKELGSDLGLTVCEAEHSSGLAILSRLPVCQIETLSDLHADWYDKPKPLHVVVQFGAINISIVCAHLPLDREGPREELVCELSAWRSPVGNMILAGDLNASPADQVIETLLDAGYQDISARSGPTMPNPLPVVKLDYILARSEQPDLFSTVSTETLGLEGDADGFLPSDHAGIFAEIALAR